MGGRRGAVRGIIKETTDDGIMVMQSLSLFPLFLGLLSCFICFRCFQVYCLVLFVFVFVVFLALLYLFYFHGGACGWMHGYNV